jgi:site-specific DNA recombinase
MTRYAVIYTRVSTDEQAEKGYSLPHQLSECRRYSQNNGFIVAKEFMDDYSGGTLDRPGFFMLREYVSRNRVDAVVVFTADRLSRNVVDFLVLRDEWERAQIELHYVDRGRSQNNFEGLLTDGIFALLAHGERLKIIQRTSDGRHNKAKHNRLVMTGIPPYGYNRMGKGAEAEYVINDVQAEVVRNIFRWYVDGDGDGINDPLSLRAIAARLDGLGISPPNYRSKMAPGWWPNTIRVILTNEIYTGRSYYGKLVTENGKRRARPKSEWKPIDVPHLAMIDVETYKRAQVRLKRNKELAKRNRKHNYLLTGHFRCGRCNKIMFGTCSNPNTKPKYAYRCSSSLKRLWRCDIVKKQVSMKKVDALVWGWLLSFLGDENNLEESLRTVMENRINDLEPKRERLKTIQGLLANADTRIHRLVDELSQYDGTAVLEAIREKIKAIENEKGLLLEEENRLSAELENMKLPQDFESQIRKIVKTVGGDLAEASIESKRRLLDVLDVRVIYDFDPDQGGKLRVSCTIPAFDKEIAFDISRRSLPRPCNSWTRRKRKSR